MFRELLQNSDDAQSSLVEIYFETAAYLERKERREDDLDVPPLPDLKSTPVLAFGFSNTRFALLITIFPGCAMDVQEQRE